jgi:hypothetical protein
VVFWLVSGGGWWGVRGADGDGALHVLCYRAFGVAPGRERRGGLGDGPDADAALAAGYQLGQDGGLGAGQGGAGAGARGLHGAADGVQGGGEGDPVRVQPGAGRGQRDDGADRLVDGQAGP